MIETAHMEIFYYPEELPIAEYVAGLAEKIYEEYAAYFEVEFTKRIPVILYGTHHDFKETNVIPYFLSEATLGFTEFIKGRVALPFMGSYGKLREVFRHELVHAFMLEKLRQVMKGYRRFTYNQPPLWFTEGLAEYLGKKGMDTTARMVIRDAVTTGNLYPLDRLWQIQGTFMMYKEGESALHYIATRFGDEAIEVILENWWKGDRFDNVLEKSIGLTVTELSRDWEEYLKKKYYPAVLNHRRIHEQAVQLSPKKKRTIEMHPVSLRGENGEDRIFCVGYGLGSIDIFELEPGSGGQWRRKTRIRGASSTRFESIPLLRSRLSAKGDTLVFSAKKGGRDAIYLYSATKEKILESVTFEGARIINSPVISYDGRYLAFSAIDPHGRSDLYVYGFEDEQFTRLTDDYFEDAHPDWHPKKHLILFTSDRCGEVQDQRYALYTIDPITRAMTALTEGEYHDTDPRWLPDGDGVIFSSDRSGTYDIYVLRDDRLMQQTNVLGGAFCPDLCCNGSFIAAAYWEGTYRVYRAPLREDSRQLPLGEIAVAESDWQPDRQDSTVHFEDRDYRIKFGLDLIGAVFVVDPGYGSTGNGAQLFFSDILNNHQIALLFGTATDNFDEFWDNINVAVTYMNRSHRLNYALGAFHLASYIGSGFDLLRFERRYGVVGGISYPISKFTRVELSGVVKWMERDDDITAIGLAEGASLIFSSFLSMTTDNITWYIGGPLRGHRVNIAVGNSADVQGSRYESTTLHIDARNYINLTERIVFAQRLLSRTAWGSDLQLFYLGGSWDLRGYRFRQFAGKRILLLNNELRFPLIDRLLLRLPLGHVDFPLFRGSAFFDVGRVDGFIYDTGWLGSFGLGVEMNLGYLPVIRLNFSKRTDFETVDKKTRIDFFLGFNF